MVFGPLMVQRQSWWRTGDVTCNRRLNLPLLPPITREWKCRLTLPIPGVMFLRAKVPGSSLLESHEMYLSSQCRRQIIVLRSCTSSTSEGYHYECNKSQLCNLLHLLPVSLINVHDLKPLHIPIQNTHDPPHLLPITSPLPRRKILPPWRKFQLIFHHHRRTVQFLGLKVSNYVVCHSCHISIGLVICGLIWHEGRGEYCLRRRRRSNR